MLASDASLSNFELAYMYMYWWGGVWFERFVVLGGEQVKEHATKAQPRVKQAKILREEAASGARAPAKSRGRGFIEFSEHEHAMAALRHLNNNPTPFGAPPPPSSSSSFSEFSHPHHVLCILGIR